MINVLKRLAELDSQNPNIVKESKIDECGIMPEMSGMTAPQQPSIPASLNITAGSGAELSDMIKAIATLAGVKPVGADDLGVEHEPSAMVATPVMGATGGPEAGGDDMRSVIDRMNDAGGPEDDQEGGEEDDKEETDEGEYDNSPADAEPKKPFNSNEFANQENQPGGGDRMDGNMPKARATFESLMDEYKEFVSESKKKVTESVDSYGAILKHYPKDVEDFKNGGELSYDLESALWDYHFNNGDIRNYDADAGEYIGQHLADYLGIEENSQPAEEAYGRRGSSGSYNPDAWAQRDWNAGQAASNSFRDQERNAGLENEPGNNVAVYINGKMWKVLAGCGAPADSMTERNYIRKMQVWADKKSAATGKKWEVAATGAPVSK